ncbi:gem-associated protein 5 isoform X2 [Scleropages formosus]|uniref:gem-associated protein 5 isoform X2 n=1 Tax=Scleropages formosus TaxID=113540 RepID=UPI0010FA8BFE|nr:gem-associated protein 5 isoform X2 [Scleropages formosus]
MYERLLPASPNWYLSRCSDINSNGVFGFGAKNTVYLMTVTPSWPVLVGELTGHKERVSGFSFCHHPGLENLCSSSSDDGTVKIWDIEQKVVLKEHRAHQSTITALHWAPAEKDLVVSGDEKGIVVCYWQNHGETQSFFPEPRSIFCLSCSPHSGNYVAVGYKDGMIVVIDITKKDEVVHRLRGHDDEIHALSWCPQPGEDLFPSHPEEGSEANSGALAGIKKGCYLASGSKDLTVRIWSTARGRGVMTLKLPNLKRRSTGMDPSLKEKLWLTVHWPKGRPSHVLSSCFGGELIMWDLDKTGKQKWSLLGSSPGSQTHSRIVFNVSSVHLGEEQEFLISTSLDREIKCWDLLTLECCWTLPTLGGYVYKMSFSPVGVGYLALGIGDNMIRVWNTVSVSNKYDSKSFWQGVKSKVTALSWHPTKEGSLAFGTDDGKVGIYEVFSSKPPQISSTYHRKTVYSLAWGPPVPPVFGAEDPPPFTLYSCAGEGLIFQHNPCKLSTDATDIDKLIRSTNSIKHKLSLHSDLSWKPDGRALAIGNEDGSIDVFLAPELKLLCTIQQHHKIINTLHWHHEHSTCPEVSYLLASGSSNAIVYVHDLRSIIESPPESPVLMTEAFRSLAGHTAKITGLSWSPHHDGRLVTACYDGTAQVWDVLTEEAVCNYRGHQGRLLCVQWSPVDPDLVWTGGDDFTVQEWAVSKQEHAKPPRGKKSVELEKKRAFQSKSKAKKKNKSVGKGEMRVEECGVPHGEERCWNTVGVEEGLSDKEEEAMSEGTSTFPPTVLLQQSNNQTERVVPEKLQNGIKSLSVSKKEIKEEKRQMGVKKRKARSIFQLSISMDHRSKEELQEDCLTLATLRHSESTMQSQCVPGSGKHIQLGLFTDRAALYRMLEEEGQNHIEEGYFESAVYLLLWKGDIAGALQMATDKGELTDHLVSMAPMAGYQVWVRTVEAFVKQLCIQEQFLKASSYLLSLHRVYEAVELLKSHQLFREAIALAKARLQPEDPVLGELYTSWAALLAKDGHYATAARCYLAADSSFDAAKVIAKKGDVASLKTAAELARIAGEEDLSHSLSLRCAKDLLSALDWLGAQEVLRTQESLLGHRLLFCTNELLVSRVTETNGITQSSTSSHSWSKPCEGDFLNTLKAVWEREFGVSDGDVEKIQAAHKQLKAVENPSVTFNVSIKQLLSQVSLNVTLCLLSWLLGDWGAGLEELLGGVARCKEAGQFSLMSEVCGMLFPQGASSVSQYKEKLDPRDERSLTVALGLQAFLSYLGLYELWWNSNDVPLTSEEGGSREPALLATYGVLLSEVHVSFQATQRAIAEIQRRLSELVKQHARTQESQADAGESPCPEVPAPSEAAEGNDSESLPSLIAMVSEHHKELANIPEHIKKTPFPDVIECCLVILHVDAISPAPPELRNQAVQLLRKYGAVSHCRASQRFLSDTH